MNSNEIIFDENHCIYDVVLGEQIDPIAIEISDSLKAANEILADDYKNRVANFVNSSKEWFPIALNKIKGEIDNISGLKLMTIYILYEQNQNDSIDGLLFNLDFDREHGRGMMLNGENFNILKYGDASVAFEGWIV
jgi:hypothetical protein